MHSELLIYAYTYICLYSHLSRNLALGPLRTRLLSFSEVGFLFTFRRVSMVRSSILPVHRFQSFVQTSAFVRPESLVEECAYEERVSCKENRLDGIWRSSESCYHCLCSTPRSNLNYEATQIPSSNVSVRVHRLPPAVVYSYSNPPHFVQSTFSGTLAGRSNETILQLLRHSPA